MGYNARNDEIATTSRGCGASGKHRGTRWRPCAVQRNAFCKGYVCFGPRSQLREPQNITAEAERYPAHFSSIMLAL